MKEISKKILTIDDYLINSKANFNILLRAAENIKRLEYNALDKILNIIGAKDNDDNSVVGKSLRACYVCDYETALNNNAHNIGIIYNTMGDGAVYGILDDENITEMNHYILLPTDETETSNKLSRVFFIYKISGGGYSGELITYDYTQSFNRNPRYNYLIKFSKTTPDEYNIYEYDEYGKYHKEIRIIRNDEKNYYDQCNELCGDKYLNLSFGDSVKFYKPDVNNDNIPNDNNINIGICDIADDFNTANVYVRLKGKLNYSTNPADIYYPLWYESKYITKAAFNGYDPTSNSQYYTVMGTKTSNDAALFIDNGVFKNSQKLYISINGYGDIIYNIDDMILPSVELSNNYNYIIVCPGDSIIQKQFDINGDIINIF